MSGRNDARRRLLIDLDALARDALSPAATIRFALLLHDIPPKSRYNAIISLIKYQEIIEKILWFFYQNVANWIFRLCSRPKKSGGDCVSGEGRRVQWETKQSHPGKSQTPVAKVAGAEETNPLKPS
jgi:hypothetical protein